MLSFRSFFFPETSGTGSGRPGLACVGKFLRFTAEGLQCCLGVKQRGLGRKALCSLLGDCSHLGRQTEFEANPLTPESFLFPSIITATIIARYVVYR
jgi:hypothetical protein